MKIPIILLALLSLASCKNMGSEKHKEQSDKRVLYLGDLNLLNATFPLRLDEVDLTNGMNFEGGDVERKRINEITRSFYFNDCGGDSSETYFSLSDTYVGTIALRDGSIDLFVVLLRHMPDGLMNSRLLFYYNQSISFIGDPIDFNIHAMYDLDSGRLKPSNLKTDLKINTPEIELVDFNHDGRKDFKLNRLYHNGTENQMETTILSVGNGKMDTLSFTRGQLPG